MLTFSQYLREIADDEFTIPAVEVQTLVNRFGPSIYGMGIRSCEGTLTLSRSMVMEALKGIKKQCIVEAALILDSTQAFNEVLDSSSADTIIERLNKAKSQRVAELVEELQNSPEGDRSEQIKNELIRLIFPE